jgi:glycerol uptake facilitator-like aquaporin
MNLGRKAAAEALGTMFLLATVVGSGIMGERLSGGNVAIALLANSLATGAILVAMILASGPISGAHFNPVVTLVAASRGALKWNEVFPYISAQIAGAFAGVAAAHLMFGEPLFSASQHVRAGLPQIFSEFVATFGLLSVIQGIEGRRPISKTLIESSEIGLRPSIPFAVGAYIAAAYWFTASTSFANPAVTLARTVTDSFSGIRPLDAPGFLAAQFAAAAAAAALFRWFYAD